MERELVFMEHDGAIDDLLSQLLLLTMDHVELIGINVTPADCYIEPALESTFKMLQIVEKPEIPIGRSNAFGVNAFPGEWRARPEIINALPMMINLGPAPDPYSYQEATDLMIESLCHADRQVTILMTGPCTNLVKAIEKEPSIRRKIKRIVWMAGAFETQGNVQTYQHNGTAEWNVYWDPISAKKLFELQLPLVCVPLDVTNQVPISKSFLSQIAYQAHHKLSNLAGQLWALTIDTIPNYYYIYFMWDVLATSYLAIPEAFCEQEVKAVVADRPPNAGQTMLSPEGHPLTILTSVDKDVFFSYVLQQLAREKARKTETSFA